MGTRHNRQILTKYYQFGELVKTNCSSRIHMAVPNCISHMQFGDYDATEAEVYDDETGKLYVQVKRHVDGYISITFRQPIPALPGKGV